MSSTPGVLFNAAGQVVFTPSGQSTPVQPGVRFGADTDHCCTPWYVQARKCSDGTLVDLWFPYVCAAGPPISCQLVTPNIGAFDLPFYFQLLSDPDTNYVVPAQPAKCAHGTLAGNVKQIFSCGKCSNCVSSSAPKSLNLSLADIEIYLHVILPESRQVRIDSDLTALPDVCMCQISDCTWLHTEKNVGTATAHLADAEVRTMTLDAVYTAARQGTGVTGEVFTLLNVYIVARETVTYTLPARPVENVTMMVFAGRSFYDNCFDETTFANEIHDYGPFPADIGITTGFPPASILSEIYCDSPCGFRTVGCGAWCAANLPSRDEVLLLGEGSSPFWWIGRSGDVTVSPGGSYCGWSPKYRVNLGGTVGTCDGSNKRGHSTVDGAYDNNGLDDSGLTIGVHYNIGPVDTIDTFTGAGCTGTASSTPGDYELDIGVAIISAILWVVEVTVRGPLGALAWYGRQEVNPNELALACGQINTLSIASNSSVYGVLPYSNGDAFLELINTP